MIRRPLVIINGRKQELPVGDTLPGGGGSSYAQAVMTIPVPRRSYGVTITDAGVTPASRIVVSLAGVLETEANSSDMIDLLGVMAVPQSGSFLLQASFLTPMSGVVKFNYGVG